MPAFFGYAGVTLQQGDAPDAEYLKKEVEMEIPTDILPTNEAEHIGLADNLQDCTVYQKIRNRDISDWGASNFNDQGITFGPKGEVFDKMKHMYQSTLHTASAHGSPGDNGGDDDDGNSDRPSHHRPEGNKPRLPQNGTGGNGNRRPANNRGNGRGRHPP